MMDFDKFKKSLKKREEEKYEKVQKDLKSVKETINHFITLFMECSSNQTHTRYTALGAE